MLLFAISAHSFNGLRSKALLSRQWSPGSLLESTVASNRHGDGIAAADPASASPCNLIASFLKLRLARCAGSVPRRETSAPRERD